MNLSPPKSGFTLIEISIVLVIIGLIIGGILVGQDMISAAAIRAQISQIEKYNTAVHTFQSKYGYLPGDIPDPDASNFGFQARGAFPGEGDGNGVLEGNAANTAGGDVSPLGGGVAAGSGELATFWVDLTTANLIDSSIVYNGVGCPAPVSHGAAGSCGTVKTWLPTSKLGSGIFVSLFSFAGANYFSLSSVNFMLDYVDSTTDPGVTIQQAYMIDSKIDDGLPQSGNTTACFAQGGGLYWAIQNGYGQGAHGAGTCTSTTTSTSYQTYNCYDNGGSNNTAQTYSMKNANSPYCALSFKFQ